MSEYEPDDSRDVTQSSHRAPGEPPRTGFREDGARLRAQAELGETPQRTGSDGFATEGDSPEHPDRFADSIPEEEAQDARPDQRQPQQGDRWKQAAEREEYVPEGK